MTSRPSYPAIAALILSLTAAVVQAQSIFPFFSTSQDGLWDGVGQLRVGNEPVCTAVLIDETLVVTAAHCLFDLVTGEPVAIDDIAFLAGWRAGRPAVHRRISRTAVHPEFRVPTGESVARLAHDLALIELQHPIRTNAIRSYKTTFHPPAGETLGVVSYTHQSTRAPNLRDTCIVLGEKNSMLILSCTVDYGDSGSPVFRLEDDGPPRLVSVISARARADGAPVALALPLDNRFETLRLALENER